MYLIYVHYAIMFIMQLSHQYFSIFISSSVNIVVGIPAKVGMTLWPLQTVSSSSALTYCCTVSIAFWIMDLSFNPFGYTLYSSNLLSTQNLKYFCCDVLIGTE